MYTVILHIKVTVNDLLLTKKMYSRNNYAYYNWKSDNKKSAIK